MGSSAASGIGRDVSRHGDHLKFALYAPGITHVDERPYPGRVQALLAARAALADVEDFAKQRKVI